MMLRRAFLKLLGSLPMHPFPLLCVVLMVPCAAVTACAGLWLNTVLIVALGSMILLIEVERAW